MEALYAILVIIVVVGTHHRGRSIKTVQQYEDGHHLPVRQGAAGRPRPPG